MLNIGEMVYFWVKDQYFSGLSHYLNIFKLFTRFFRFFWNYPQMKGNSEYEKVTVLEFWRKFISCCLKWQNGWSVRITSYLLLLFFFFCSRNNLKFQAKLIQLTLSWRRPLSYRNQSIDLQSKSMDWFLYDRDLRHERVKSQ